MIPWNTRLTPDQARDLVLYVRNFGPRDLVEAETAAGQQAAAPSLAEFDNKMKSLRQQFDDLEKQLQSLPGPVDSPSERSSGSERRGTSCSVIDRAGSPSSRSGPRSGSQGRAGGRPEAVSGPKAPAPAGGGGTAFSAPCLRGRLVGRLRLLAELGNRLGEDLPLGRCLDRCARRRNVVHAAEEGLDLGLLLAGHQCPDPHVGDHVLVVRERPFADRPWRCGSSRSTSRRAGLR